MGKGGVDMIDTYIVTQLESITAITGKIFPVDAPESQKMPYVTYALENSDEKKSHEGYRGLFIDTFAFDIISKRADEVKTITKAIRDKLKSIEKTNIGVYIQEVTIDSASPELKEYEIQAIRKILTVKISYQED